MAAFSKLQLVKPEDAALAQRHAIIDEFAELKRKEAAFNLVAPRLKLLRKTIEGWIPTGYPTDQPLSFSSPTNTVLCSMAENERYVKQPSRLLKFLGAAKFWALCSVGIGALEELMGKGDAAKWLTQDRTGPRKITAVANASPAAKEAA
jgi:hypothetical protein